MHYYELLDNETFIGVCSSQEFCKYQVKHQILLQSDEKDGQYLQYNGSLYRDDWMKGTESEQLKYHKVSVIEIDEEEYKALQHAIESGEEIVVEDPIEEPVRPEDPEDYDAAVEFARNSKIRELSNICNQIITDGFDVELSDGGEHHFSLTIQDQLNLITLSTMIAAGEAVIPYHADGELCKGYPAEDIAAILAAATEFKTYHVTYFNSLKAYVMSLGTLVEIGDIEYGSNIPEEYQSEILREMMRGL